MDYLTIIREYVPIPEELYSWLYEKGYSNTRFFVECLVLAVRTKDHEWFYQIREDHPNIKSNEACALTIRFSEHKMFEELVGDGEVWMVIDAVINKNEFALNHLMLLGFDLPDYLNKHLAKSWKILAVAIKHGYPKYKAAQLVAATQDLTVLEQTIDVLKPSQVLTLAKWCRQKNRSKSFRFLLGKLPPNMRTRL
jgi:hypothetical protein